MIYSVSCDVTTERFLRRSCLDKGIDDTTQQASTGCGQTDCLTLVKYFVSLFGFKESESQICEDTEGAIAKRTILANTHKRYNKQNAVGSKWPCKQEKRSGLVEKKYFYYFNYILRSKP